MRILPIFLVLLFIVAPAFSQEQAAQLKHHPFSGTLVLGVEAGATWGRTDFSNVQSDLMGRAMVEYFLPTTSAGALGFRGFINGGYVSGERSSPGVPMEIRTPFNNLGGGLSYMFSVQDVFFPYIFAGASYMWFSPQDGDGNDLPGNIAGSYGKNEANYHAELGARLGLSTEITLNLSVGTQISTNDNWDELIGGGNNDHMLQTMLGLSYAIFATSDDDKDGVEDENDRCPKTPEGVVVDEFGCPLDSDGDGVPDHLDKCQDTKPGLEVDKDGCATDSDGDGVPNSNDRCANTASGVRVDGYGCPDTDGDGIADGVDKCPETPEKVQVDSLGCPLDTDKDGVADHKDECPNTPVGQQVNERGCSTEKETKIIMLSGDTNFETKKSNLLPAAYATLDNLAENMKVNPETRWRIEGHTDSNGSDEYNMKLSQERAEAVVQYIAGKGIDRSRFEIVPLGETQPVGDNSKSEGRAMNRRVEIKLIEK